MQRVATVKAEHQDLFRRDQQRLADWPPRFRGEGPFLPTGRRKSPRALYAIGALLVVLLMSGAGTPWRLSALAGWLGHAAPAEADAKPAHAPTDSATLTK